MSAAAAANAPGAGKKAVSGLIKGLQGGIVWLRACGFNLISHVQNWGIILTTFTFLHFASRQTLGSRQGKKSRGIVRTFTPSIWRLSCFHHEVALETIDPS
eukprot:scaffold190_cov171-Amphora_coffeaeformis.AAC.8